MPEKKEIPFEHYGVTHVDVIRKLKAKNKKLQNALEEIIIKAKYNFSGNHKIVEIRDIAKKALKDGE